MISHIPSILLNFKALDFFVLFKHCHLTSGTGKSYTQKICISTQQIYLLIKTVYKNVRGDNRHYQYTGSTEKKKILKQSGVIKNYQENQTRVTQRGVVEMNKDEQMVEV